MVFAAFAVVFCFGFGGMITKDAALSIKISMKQDEVQHATRGREEDMKQYEVHQATSRDAREEKFPSEPSLVGCQVSIKLFTSRFLSTSPDNTNSYVYLEILTRRAKIQQCD